MQVIILAAGYGTRLYPLAKSVSKSLITIGGKPIINFLIEKVNNLKKITTIEDIAVVTNDKFYRDFLGWKKKYGLRLELINDGSHSPEERLGAIGDLKLAIKNKKNKDFLILGGDNLFEDTLEGFTSFVTENKNATCVALYDVKDKKLAAHYGVVRLKSNRIIELEEKPAHPKTSLVATCIYYLPRDALKLLDAFLVETPHADASGKYIEWLVRKTDIFGHILKGKWFDIGHYDSLKSAEEAFRR